MPQTSGNLKRALLVSAIAFALILTTWAQTGRVAEAVSARAVIAQAGGEPEPVDAPTAPPIAPEDSTTQTTPSIVGTRILFPLVRLDSGFYGSFPANGETGRSLNVFLQWRFANAAAPAPRFRILLDAGAVNPHTVVADQLSRLSFDPPTFAPDTLYSWQVIALGANGAQIPGPVWTFRTEAFSDPPDVKAMSLVPAGESVMGCDTANPASVCSGRNSPLHAVWLDAYLIDKYEVTNQEYRACVAAGFCNPPRRSDSLTHPSYFRNPAFDYFPVLYVSHWDAEDFCAWEGKRLPTEAEWEKAARGDIDTRTWPWGNELADCSRANITNEHTSPWTICRGDTVRVGSYPTGESPYGVMDMAGNVFEWVHDAFSENYYKMTPYANPQGPAYNGKGSTSYFVIRGSSYRPRLDYTRVFHRHFGHHGDRPFDDKPFYRNNQVGFRCARSVPNN